MVMKGGEVDTDADYSRGLEFKSPQKNKARQQKKQVIIWTVIDEQERFIEQNPGDLNLQQIKARDDALAAVYNATQCVSEAYNRGLKDGCIAKKCWET